VNELILDTQDAASTSVARDGATFLPVTRHEPPGLAPGRPRDQDQLEQIAVDGREAIDLLLGQRAFERRGEKGSDFVVLRTVHGPRMPRKRGERKSEFSEIPYFLLRICCARVKSYGV